MFRRIDESPFLIRLLQRISGLLARQRGLPVIVGILFVFIGFVVQFVNVYADSQALEIVYIVFHNLGIILALTGLLLAEPLGR